MTFLSGLTNRFTSSTVAAAAAAPPTAAQFEGWSAGAQAAYLSANSADDPPFLVIGDPGGGQVLATLGFDGQTVATAPVPQSYADAASSGNPPSSDDFAAWDPELQLAYVRASGVTPPTALVLGNAAGPQTLAALNWNDTGVAITPVPASYTAAIASGTAPTAGDFQGWPQQLQLAYFQANSSGSPPFLIVGDPKDAQVLATLGPGGTGVVTSNVPQSYSALALAAATLKAHPTAGATLPLPSGSDAQTWAPQLQLSYLQSVSTDHPPFLVLGDPAPGGQQTAPTQTLVTLSQDRRSLDKATAPASYSNAMATGLPPTAGDAAAWPAALRLSFLRTGSADVPPFLVAGDASGKLSLLTLDSHGRMDRRAVPPDYADAILGTATPPATDFGAGTGAWAEPLQLSYLRAKGTGAPPALVLDPTSPSGVLVTLSPDGKGAVATALPQSYAVATAAYAAAGPGAAPRSLAAFQALTQAQQLAYLQSNGTGNPPALVVDAGQADAVLATASAAGAVTVTPMAAVLQGWAPPLQLAFVQGNGTGTPKSMVLGTGQDAYTASVTASGTAVAVVKGDVGSPSYWGLTTSAPSAAAALAAAQTVTADVLASWPLAAQVSYLQANGTGSPPTLLLPAPPASASDPTPTSTLVSLAPGSDVIQLDAVTDQYLADLYGAPYNGTSPDAHFKLSTLQGWPSAVQTYFVANSAGGSVTMYDDVYRYDDNQPITATLNSDGTGVSLTTVNPNSDLLKGINTSSPIPSAEFFSLPPDQQLSVYQTQLQNSSNLIPASGQPGMLKLDGGGGPTITLTVGGTSFQVQLASNSYGGLSDAIASGKPDSATDFVDWPLQIQTAYVAQCGQPGGSVYPKTLALDGTTVAYLPAADAQVTKVDSPVNLAPPPSIAMGDFLSWPYPIQLAFLQAQPSTTTTNADGTKTTAKAAVFGSDPNRVEAALNPNGAGFQVAWASDLTQASAPGVDWALYSKVAPLLAQAQLLAQLSDPGSSPPVVTVKPTAGALAGTPVVISGGSAATGGGLTIEPIPAGYATAPSALSPAAFMAWSPAVRASYVLSQVSGSAVAAAWAAGTPLPTLTIGTGVSALSVTFSPSDGTLQITVPQTLADVASSGAVATALAGTLLPYDYLPGSAVGTTSAIDDAVAGALYPILDGSGGAHDIAMTAQQQKDAALPPAQLSATTFSGWPTALQLQYLRAWQVPGTPLTIGTGSSSIDVLMQTTAQAGTVPKIYVVQNLQKTDIGAMSYADQATLAKSTAFQALAYGLGLIPDAGAATGSIATLSGSDAPDPNAGLTTASTTPPTLSAFGYVQQMFVTALNTIEHPTLVANQEPGGPLSTDDMPASDKQVFESEIDLLRRQTFGAPLPASQANQSSGQAIFSPKDIQDKITAIITRFSRANAFASVADANTASTSQGGQYVIDGVYGQEQVDKPFDPSQTYTRPDYFYNPGSASGQDLDNFFYSGGSVDDSYSTWSPAIADLVQGLQNSSQVSLDATSYQPQVINLSASSSDVLTSTGSKDEGATFAPASIVVQRLPPDWTGGSGSGDGRNFFDVGTPPNTAKFTILSVSGNYFLPNSTTPQPVFAFKGTDQGDKQNFSGGFGPGSNGFGYWDGADNGASLIANLTANNSGLASTLADGQPHAVTLNQPKTYTVNGLTFTVSSVVMHWVPDVQGVSTDNNATIKSGYATFMSQEQTILSLADRADQLATSGKLGGTQQNLDVPNLVYLFSLYSNLTGEAVLRGDTEEVNQTNALLNEYAQMQKLINQTVSHIAAPTSDDQYPTGTLYGSGPGGALTDADKAVIAMFNQNQTLGTGAGNTVVLSPIEMMQTGFKRPPFDLSTTNSQQASSWNAFGTSLSDAVTQLNQSSQIKMNGIDSETKQKDRESDLANSALQQAQTVLNQVASTVSA